MYRPLIYILAVTFFFLLYLFIFYKREKQIQFKKCLANLLNDVQLISQGHFTHPIKQHPFAELNKLSENVQGIVGKLKTSLDEELKRELAKNELITNVSHDLRTPLTSIVGYLNLIENDKYKDEVELHYFIQVIVEKVNRLTNLVNDLFDYTRLRNKGVKLNLVPIDLIEMLVQVEVHFRPELKEADMQLRYDFPDQKLTVLADGNKLARVFENILSNALKYGKGKYIDICVEALNDSLSIAITNYGNPIPSTDLPHIFERFYRVEKSRSDKTGGSGLGLAIAKGIIDLHGGQIEVSSDQEKTVFTIQIPVH